MMEALAKLTNHLSNAAQAFFLLGMIFIALGRLTDGKREGYVERISLFLISVGAFFQLVKAAHPVSTSWDVLLTNFGLLLLLVAETYKVTYKQQI
jgi:hypothetical protein